MNFSAEWRNDAQQPNKVITNPAWLVSVRSEHELAAVCDFDVDFVDFKEPNHGPLAPVSPELWRTAANIVAGDSAPPLLSAALGEREQMRRIAQEVPASFAFAKVGPSDCDSTESLQSLWQDARDRLPDSVELVAVAYADFCDAKTLPPEEIFRLAQDSGFTRGLIDTFSKRGRSTVDALGTDRLGQLSELASELHLWWALAGSIDRNQASQLMQQNIRPDCFGVRGDVCGEDRTSTICGDRMRAWSTLLRPESR